MCITDSIRLKLLCNVRDNLQQLMSETDNEILLDTYREEIEEVESEIKHIELRSSVAL